MPASCIVATLSGVGKGRRCKGRRGQGGSVTSLAMKRSFDE